MYSTEEIILFIIGDVHQFIGHCLIPLYLWVRAHNIQNKVYSQVNAINAVNTQVKQGSKGIIHAMVEKFLYIPINDTITSSVDYNYLLKSLDTQPKEPTNQNSIKVPKVVKQRVRKHYYKTLGTSVINVQCPLPPCSSSQTQSMKNRRYKYSS